MGIIKKIETAKIDFSKIATSASNANNGSFLDINSINTSCWGDSNNTVDIELVDGYDDVYLVSENGSALGFTTGDFSDDVDSSDLLNKISNDGSNPIESIYDDNGNLLYTVSTIFSKDGLNIQLITNADGSSVRNYYHDVNGKSVLYTTVSYDTSGNMLETKRFYDSGNVRSVKSVNGDGSYSVMSYGDNDSGLWENKSFYDKDGKFEKLYTYSVDGDYNVINVYDNVSGDGNPIGAMKYDQNWQKISDITYYVNGKYSETIPYKDGEYKTTYDENGNILNGSYIVDGKVQCLYKYNDGKVVSRTDYYGDSSIGKINYDSSGKVTSFTLSDVNGNSVISLNGEGKWVSYNGYAYFINGFGNLVSYPISSFSSANDGSGNYYMVTDIDGTKYVTVTNYDGKSAGDIVGYYSVSQARQLGIMPKTLDSVPHFNQNDYSNVKFWDGSTIKNSGCGFCSVASVIGYFTGNENYTPISACEDYGDQYMMRTGGMSHALIPRVANDYGLSCTQTKNINTVVEALKNGAIVVTSQNSRGIFTSSGHIMTLSGVDSNGNIIVDDSLRSSTQSFSPATVDKGATNYWILSN